MKQSVNLEQQWATAEFWQWQADYSPTSYYIAVSGGRDSMALMHLLSKSKYLLKAPLKVIYINHLWHENAMQWSEFVATQAQLLSLPFQSITVDYSVVERSSPEAMARQARYKIFANLMQERSVLLTAHHQDDQAETLLLQLMRGAGLAGLASMAQRSDFARGQHWRPLLTYSREMIELYVQQYGIAYLDDPSNEDDHYRRNWLRKEIMPALVGKQVSVKQNIARSATWLGEALALEKHLLSRYLSTDNLNCLLVKPWINEPIFLQKALLRLWLNELSIPALNSKQQQELLSQVRQGTGHPMLKHGQYVLLYYDDCLYAFRQVSIAKPPSFHLPANHLHIWEGIGELQIERGVKTLYQMSGKLEWTLYPPGGNFRPMNAQHHHSLKEWFRRYRIPPYIRQQTPILCLGDEIIWVGGLGSAFGYEWLGINWQKKAHSVSISTYPLSVSDNS